jgi:MFS family permease
MIAAAGSLVMGFGMGIASVSSLVLIQEMVDASQRGSATASNLFSRNLGSTLGATAFGAVLNIGLTRSNVTSDELKQVLDSAQALVGADSPIRLALHQSLHMTFLAIFGVALAILLSALLVPSNPHGRARDVAAPVEG